MANEYPGANNERTMEGNTKDADATSIVSAVPGNSRKTNKNARFKKLKKLLKECK